jgi:hypothetical protein
MIVEVMQTKITTLFYSFFVNTPNLNEPVEMDFSPIEAALLFNKRHLRPIDVFSTLMYFINNQTITINNEQSKIDNKIFIFDINKKEGLLSHEIHLLDYLASFGKGTEQINIEGIINGFISKDRNTKKELGDFFEKLTHLATIDLIEKSYIKPTMDPKTKLLWKLIPLFMFTFSGLYANLPEGESPSSASIMINLFLFAFVAGFFINSQYDRVNIKLHPMIKKDYKHYKSVRAAYYLFRSSPNKAMEFSQDNLLLLTSYWFTFEKSYNKKFNFLKDMLFSFAVNVTTNRNNSKKLFLRFANKSMQKIASGKNLKPNSIFDKSFYLSTKSEIKAKSSFEVFLKNKLESFEKVTPNNALIHRLFELTILLEKSYKI